MAEHDNRAVRAGSDRSPSSTTARPHLGRNLALQLSSVRIARTKPTLGGLRHIDFPKLQTYLWRAYLSLADDRGRLLRTADIHVQRLVSPSQVANLIKAKYRYAKKRMVRDRVHDLTTAPNCEMLDRVLQAKRIASLQ